jgi:hypothetical protein
LSNLNAAVNQVSVADRTLQPGESALFTSRIQLDSTAGNDHQNVYLSGTLTIESDQQEAAH